MSSNTKFRPIAGSFLLLLLVIAVSLTMQGIVWVLANILKLFPASDAVMHAVGLISAFAGTQLYGSLTEKKYPGLLTSKNINKLAVVYSITNVFLSIFVIIGMSAIQPTIKISVEMILFTAVFITLFTYFTVRIFVKSGVHTQQKLIKKN